MDMQPEAKAVINKVAGKECHCSVCFAEIKEDETVHSAHAGRYYCSRCMAMFKGAGRTGQVRSSVKN